ncbi:MAG TPA: type II toxin-antitoxin system VapC family toxin [Thermoanaerobaculia bacterium]|jgi:predicted nucleic acid-binding protein|nr:type II toxin-antitoxin system VapC family toxin [Thermoanaerobaculia bacterium]
MQPKGFFTEPSVAGRRRFFVPDIFYIECANIFWKYVRRFNVPQDHARKSLVNLASLALLSVSSDELLHSALDLALEYGTSAYDASYVALSHQLNLPFVTADEKLIRKLEGSGTDAVWLGDFGS